MADVPSVPDLGNLFGGSDSNPFDMLTELLNPDNISMKTDLNMTQIRILCKMKWFQLIKDPENKDKEPVEIFNMVLIFFMELMTSLKRKSREEHIQGIKGLSNLNEQFIQQSPLMQGLGK